MGKKSTEILDPKVDLSKTTQLVFGLTKADVIDYYMGEEEEDLENKIKKSYQEFEQLRKTEDALDSFKNSLISNAIKKHKKVITAAKKAVTNFVNIGRIVALAPKLKISIIVDNPVIIKETLNTLSFWKYSGHKSIQKFQKIPEYCVDVNALQHLGNTTNFIYAIIPDENSSISIRYDGISTGSFEIEWDSKLKILAEKYCEQVNARNLKFRELYALLCEYEELPQLKKKIKKNVIGRVLKNTKDGKLLLEALKGIGKINKQQALLTG